MDPMVSAIALGWLLTTWILCYMWYRLGLRKGRNEVWEKHHRELYLGVLGAKAWEDQEFGILPDEINEAIEERPIQPYEICPG